MLIFIMLSFLTGTCNIVFAQEGSAPPPVIKPLVRPTGDDEDALPLLKNDPISPNKAPEAVLDNSPPPVPAKPSKPVEFDAAQEQAPAPLKPITDPTCTVQNPMETAAGSAIQALAKNLKPVQNLINEEVSLDLSNHGMKLLQTDLKKQITQKIKGNLSPEKITKLNLSGRKLDGATLHWILIQFPNITSLDLSGSSLKGNDLFSLIKYGKKIETLNLSDTALTPENLAPIENLKELKRLNLNRINYPKTAEKIRFDFLDGLKKLETVQVWGKSQSGANPNKQVGYWALNRWAEKAAKEKKNPFALAQMATAYMNGVSKSFDEKGKLTFYPVDLKTAEKLANDSETLRSQTGKFLSARLKEIADPKNNRSWPIYESLAQEGFLPAMAHIGRNYPKLPLEAKLSSLDLDRFDFCQMAANAGDPDAMTCLGERHQFGHNGTPIDLKKAAEFYNKASTAGSSDGTARLASLVNRNIVPEKLTAFDYLRQAAQHQGSSEAYLNLALLSTGSLNPPSKVRIATANKFFDQAIARGNSAAIAHKARFQEKMLLDGWYSKRGTPEGLATINGYREAARKGDPTGQAYLGYLLARDQKLSTIQQVQKDGTKKTIGPTDLFAQSAAAGSPLGKLLKVWYAFKTAPLDLNKESMKKLKQDFLDAGNSNDPQVSELKQELLESLKKSNH